MTALTAAGMLLLFEEGQRRDPLARAAMAIAIAGGEPAPLTLTAGELEARLLALRERTFGPELEGVAVCPACGERCETALRTSDILALPPGREPVLVERDGIAVQARLPRGDDIAHAMRLRDPEAIRRAMLERCIVRASVDPIPEEILDEVEDALAAADPRADVQLALTCPACAHEWLLRFDAAAFFWSELAAAAERVLHEVDVLARAYGWSESEILSMSARRRALYVERIES